MERLRERLDLAERALSTLRELAGLEAPSAVERDAAIQRFEYSFEATWRAAQRYLSILEGMDLGSPKAAIRAARDVGVLTDEEAESALAMTDDRNLTVHTYNEPLAKAIFGRLSDHLSVMSAWLAAMTKRVDAG